MFITFIHDTWQVIGSSSPYLFFGLFCAGLLHTLVSTTTVKKQLQKPGLWSVLKASLIGVPLPLCSCSVIPVGIALRRAGASRGAVASFFTSTPEIGADSFVLSYGLLGPFLAITRIVASFLSAFIVGISIDHFVAETPLDHQTAQRCCNNNNNGATSHPTLKEKINVIFSYGFGKILRDIANILVFGFIASGIISALVPETWFQDPSLTPVTSTLIMIAISIPLYVCATSSTPIAAALLAKGMFPGAVLAFLLAGPATNITAIIAFKKELGLRAMFIYIGGIFIISFIFGTLINLTYTQASSVFQIDHFGHQHQLSLLENISGVIMTALLARSIWLNNKRSST